MELTVYEMCYLIRLVREDHKELLGLIDRLGKESESYDWLQEELEVQKKILEKLEYGTN